MTAQVLKWRPKLAQVLEGAEAAVVADNSWFLQHDNVPSHTALVLRDHFVKISTHIFPQPPYSSDFPPCDFWKLTQKTGDTILSRY